MSRFISVVLPVFNAPHNHLAPCLDSLLQIDYPKDSYEIIIIDDGSTNDVTNTIIKSFSLSEKNRLLYYRYPNKGTAVARNHGIAVARGELVAFTDADCVVDSNWLQAFDNAFKDPLLCGVGGLTLSFSVRTYVEQYCDYFGSLRTPIYRNNRVYHIIGVNSCWRSEALKKVGGFNKQYEYFAEKGIVVRGYTDLELSRRLAVCGYRLGYVPTAIVYHQHRRNLRSRIRQFYHYGAGGAFLYYISRYKLSKLGRYDPGYPPRLLQIMVLLIREAAMLPFRPLLYCDKRMRIDQRFSFPIFDYLQRVAFCFGFYKLHRQLINLKSESG